MIEAFDCVVAADRAGGIGRDNDLPWPKLREDLRFLRVKTQTAPAGKRNAVIMGRRTWDSVPAKFRPLPGRLNVVVSRRALELGDDAIAARSLDEALVRAGAQDDIDALYVIGGGEIFRQAFADRRCRDVYLTRIDAVYECDAFLPPMDGFDRVAVLGEYRDSDVDYRIEQWRRRGWQPGTGTGTGTGTGADAG